MDGSLSPDYSSDTPQMQTENLQTENLQAEKLQAEFDKIMYHISHDLGGSTRAISDIPQWIIEDLSDANIVLPEEINNHLRLLIRHSNRLENMMQGFLEYSRVGRYQGLATLDPSKVLSWILEETAYPETWEIINNVSSCTLRMSKHDLTALFKCLISNPIKHSDQNHGRLEINSHIEDGFVKILFSDDGPGIEPQWQDKIFEMMKTLKSRDQVEGSGLGLSICKKICDHYGGDIWVDSSPAEKRGSVFGVSLPIHDSDSAQ